MRIRTPFPTSRMRKPPTERGRHLAGSGVFAPFAGICGTSSEVRALCGNDPCGAVAVALISASSCDGVVKGVGGAGAKGRGRKVPCEDCFFGRTGLCALGLDEPCATFRRDHPEGLRPPSQLRFV